LKAPAVARVRLAVQQLLAHAPPANLSSQVSQRVAKQLPVRVGKCWSTVAVRHKLLRRVDAIGEVGCGDIELAHAGMEALERSGVVGWGDLSRCPRFVGGPQRDLEAVTLIDPRLHSRLKSRDRAPDCGEPLSKLHFESCDLMSYRCHPGQHVSRQQSQRELVRVLQHDRVVDGQITR
jgi:hypothetical protein